MTFARGHALIPADLNHVRWVSHCPDLVQLPSRWLRTRQAQNILIVLTDGDILWDNTANDFDWSRTTAMPAALRGHFASEPLYVDLRWAKDQSSLTLDNPQFSQAIAMLASVIHGLPMDTIRCD